MMVRTQIQLSESQARSLKLLAAAQGRSMADLIRECVDALIAGSNVQTDERRRQRALSAVGRFHSDATDLAEHHDRHLADAFERP